MGVIMYSLHDVKKDLILWTILYFVFCVHTEYDTLICCSLEHVQTSFLLPSASWHGT